MLVSLKYKQTDSPHHAVLDIDKADAQSCPPVTRKRKQPAKSALKTKENSESNKVPLVQATISTLFKKAGEKVWFQLLMKYKFMAGELLK